MKLKDAERLQHLQRFILQVAGGEYTPRSTLSPGLDELDATFVAVTILAEELQEAHRARLKAEALLRDERDAYDHAPGMFCSVDADHLTIIKANATLLNALGWRRDELLGRSVLDLHSHEERQRVARTLAKLATGLPHELGEFTLVRRNGARITVTLNASFAEADPLHTRRFRLIWRDISEQRQLELRLIQAQKMEAIGQLAGGVAHDFNNLLTVIQNYAQFVSEAIGSGHPAQDDMAPLLDATRRAAQLTSHLLAFSRRQMVRPRPTDLNRLIANMEALLRSLVTESVRLEIALAPEELVVQIDPTQFEQVLMNLAINAHDAMPDGGMLRVWTRRVDAPPEGQGGAARVILGVADTGTGMTEEVRLRAFEPFFSTKGVGAGTGLGLSTCYGIVKQAGGDVVLLSDPGQGTTVEISLTLQDQIIAASGSGEPRATQGSETILLVEDEPQVLRVTQRILQRAGYSVMVAASGDEALELLETGSVPAAVVTDVVMPGMGGVELARVLRENHPDLPVVFVSGYMGSADSLRAQGLDTTAFLTKPFLPQALLEKLRALLVSAEG